MIIEKEILLKEKLKQKAIANATRLSLRTVERAM